MQVSTKVRFIVEPAESLILKVIAVLLLVNLAMIATLDASIDWLSYGALTLVAVGCFIGGQFYRVSGRSPRIGLALICTGIFSIFSWAIVLFNYLLMPTNRPPIDEALVWFDSLYGYNWPDYVAWGAENPLISSALKIAYQSSLAQMGLLIIVLGMTGRQQQLHVMMMSVVITSVLAVLFWWGFPSHGPAALYTLIPGIEEIVQPTVTIEYGQELVRMAADGPGFISPSNVKGLIGFPSYHIVLALTCAYFMRGVKGFFPIFVVLNALVFVATPLHGGHHLVDVFGGVALFILGAVLADRLVSKLYQKSDRSALLESDLVHPVAA